MYWLLKNKSCVKVFISIIVLAFTAPAFSFGTYPSRIIPTGTVSMYQGNTKVGEFTAEAPLPEGSLLECNGKCGVKMNDTYMVAKDKSVFSITNSERRRELRVNKGMIYFALSALPLPLEFQTPAGIITVQRLILNAASDGNLLKGYVSVTQTETEVGVIEGGSMLVLTPKDETMIKTGKRIILAQQPEGGVSLTTMAAVGGIILGGTLLLGALDDDDQGPASPAE